MTTTHSSQRQGLLASAPLLVVVERDPLTAECALSDLMIGNGAPGGLRLEWRRTAGWKPLGPAAGSFGLTGKPLPEEIRSVDAAAVLAQLLDHAEGLGALGGTHRHPLAGAVLWMKDLEEDLEDALVISVLRDLVGSLGRLAATLVVEVVRAPAPDHPVRRIARVVDRPERGAARHGPLPADSFGARPHAAGREPIIGGLDPGRE